MYDNSNTIEREETEQYWSKISIEIVTLNTNRWFENLHANNNPKETTKKIINIIYAYGRPGFNPWFGKIPWRMEWLPTPVF